jgi:multiple sugar transport system permease protein
MEIFASRTPYRSRRRRLALKEGSRYTLLMVLAVLFFAPFLWLVSIALKTQSQLAIFPILFWPSQPDWQNFVQALTLVPFWNYAANSVILAMIYAVLTTLSSALVGFGFARLKGRGKRLWFVVLLSTMMLPQIVTLIPTYVLFARLNLVNTYWPWVLWGVGASPFLVFLYRQFFAAIPTDLEEAAILDGCGYGQIFWRIFLPLSLPVIVTAFLLSFVWVWGDYVTPTLLLSQDNTTLAVAISASYVDPNNNPLPNVQAAAALLYILPEIVVFFFAQRYFVRGIVTSGLKG